MTPEFIKLLQEAAERPDSPSGLRVRSFVSSALQPRTDSIIAVVESILRHRADASPVNVNKLNDAIDSWQTITGLTFDEGIAAEFNELAKKELQRRRTKPPALEDIVHLTKALDRDYEYELAGTLGGVRGIWHRLWSSISLEHAQLLSDEPEDERLSSALRKEFEDSFGRPLSESEWNDLVSHARNHAETVLIPSLGK